MRRNTGTWGWVIGVMVVIALVITPGGAIQAQSGEPHRIGIRTTDGAAAFYDTVTGERFVPRGTNYIAWKQDANGAWHDWVFQTDQFDSGEVRAAFRDLAGEGYNTVRIFLDICGTGPYCINNPDGDGLNPGYIANIASVMQIAADEGIYLILTSNDLPEAGGYWQMVDQGTSAQMGGYRNANYLTEAGVEATRTYWRDLLGVLVELDPPFESVLAWSLLNEQFFLTDLPPFTLESGVVETAAGSYDMGDPEQRRQMTTDNLNYYIDQVSAVIRDYDPDSLITMGFFAPNEPNQWRGSDDNRLVDTAPLLATASLDFFDFHAYPGGQETLDQLATNYGMDGYTQKPIIMGEVGAFRSAYETAAAGAYGLQQWIAASCEHGFAGWLTWEYYGEPEAGVLGDGVWGTVDEDSVIGTALAPATQPDPCVAAAIDLPNAALGKPVTGSRALPDEPAANATDGSEAQWGSGADAPQWAEVDLGDPVAVRQIRLSIAQWPAGDTHHQVWGRRSDGAMILLAEFNEYTRDPGWLETTFDAPVADIQAVRVETLASPSWVSWREIEVYRGDAESGAACVVTSTRTVNLRAEPTTNSAIATVLLTGRGAVVTGSETGADGFVWWQLVNGAWVRSDVVTAGPGCS